MSQFWTPSSYFMLDRCNPSTNSFTLAQLSPVDQIQLINLRTIIGSITTILRCLQPGQAELSPTTANRSPLIHQNNIPVVKIEWQNSLLTIVKRGLLAITPGKIWQFFVTPDVVSGRASFSLPHIEKRRYQN